MEKELQKEIIADLKIDIDNLSEDVATIPELFMHYGRKWAQSQQNRDAMKTNCEEVWAKREHHWREQFAKTGEKTTEGAIKAKVNTDPVYLKAVEEENEAKYEADIWTIVKDAFRYKKDMLQSLVQLTIAEMSSGIKQPKVDIDALARKTGAAIVKSKLRERRKGGE